MPQSRIRIDGAVVAAAQVPGKVELEISEGFSTEGGWSLHREQHSRVTGQGAETVSAGIVAASRKVRIRQQGLRDRVADRRGVMLETRAERPADSDLEVVAGVDVPDEVATLHRKVLERIGAVVALLCAALQHGFAVALRGGNRRGCLRVDGNRRSGCGGWNRSRRTRGSLLSLFSLRPLLREFGGPGVEVLPKGIDFRPGRSFERLHPALERLDALVGSGSGGRFLREGDRGPEAEEQGTGEARQRRHSCDSVHC